MAVTELDTDLLDAFSIPEGAPHPADIVERLMNDPEHRHLRDNNIQLQYLFRHESKVKGGKVELGSVNQPTCQGAMRPVFEWMLTKLFGFMPHYVVILDKGFWDSVTAETREALLWHELSHVKQAKDDYGEPRFNRQTGEPIYQLVDHDITAFNSEVERYGAWSPDIHDFLQAARRHG